MLLCFIKHNLRNKITSGRENRPQSALMYLVEAKQEVHLEGTQCSPRADGVCWTPAGRCLSDACSDIFLLLPPFQSQRCNSATATFPPILCRNSPLPQRWLGQFTTNVAEATRPCFRTSVLPSSPHQTSPSSKCSGKEEVIIGRADVPPLLTNQGNNFTLVSGNKKWAK